MLSDDLHGELPFADRVAARVADEGRLSAVASTGLLDSPAEPAFDRIAMFAARLLDAPYGFITVVDERRSFWKACIGVDATDSGDRQNPVEESFCQYVIGTDDAFAIDDTRLDERTRENPSIESMGVLAWAGVPLRAPGGEILGTVCVVDTRTRSWTDHDVETLTELAAIAADEVVSASEQRASGRSEALLTSVLTRAPIGFALVDDALRYELINQTLADINGYPVEQHLGRTVFDLLPDVADDVATKLRRVLDSGETIAGSRIVGSTPADPGVERVWIASYYRLDLDGEQRAAMFVEEITDRVRSQRRSEQLATISGALAKAETLEQIEQVVVHDIAAYFEASAAVVGHWDDDAGRVTVLASPSVRQAVEAESLRFDDDAPYAEAARTREIVTVSDPRDRRDRFTSDVGPAFASEAVVPCVTGDGEFVGTLTVGWDRPRPSNEFPRARLRTVGRLIAGAFERNRLHRHRRQLIDALAQTVVKNPPEVQGIELAVRYRAASTSLGFGGDWYDIVAIDDSVTALIIGDVAGHDPVAAARTSQIASIVAQLLLLRVDLTHVFREAERTMDARGIDAMATVAVVVVDTERRSFTSMSAGHLPGVLVSPDGTLTALASALRPPLTGFGTETTGLAPVAYEPGTKLVMFSDGLVETRGGALDDDLARLWTYLGGCQDLHVDDLADKLLADFAPPDDQFDDIALLLAHLR